VQRFTKDELARKVRWEGGALDAIEYGIRSEQIDDPELRDLWRALEDGYRALTPLVTTIETRLQRGA
jgi:hypothetical protein